jgi:hypothetical protein
MTNDLTQCSRCGQPHTRCSAHRHDGQPCGSPPVEGATVCRMHGGTTKQVREAATRRKAQETARAAVTRYRVWPEAWPESSPEDQLARLINISAGLVSFYDWQLSRLKPDALIWGDTEVRQDFRGLTVAQKGEANMWLRLFNDERRELRQLCAAAITAGLAEREVRLAEEQGALVVEVFRRALTELELTVDQQAMALVVIPRLLREVGAETESGTNVVPLPRGRG